MKNLLITLALLTVTGCGETPKAEVAKEIPFEIAKGNVVREATYLRKWQREYHNDWDPTMDDLVTVAAAATTRQEVADAKARIAAFKKMIANESEREFGIRYETTDLILSCREARAEFEGDRETLAMINKLEARGLAAIERGDHSGIGYVSLDLANLTRGEAK